MGTATGDGESFLEFLKQRNFSGEDRITQSRDRSQSFTKVMGRKISPPEMRERASTFSQMKSNKYLERVKIRREKNLGLDPPLNSVKEEKTPSNTQKLGRSMSLCGSSPADPSQFYEVLFLGKIKASHSRAPATFIDEALNKFKRRDERKLSNESELKESDAKCVITPSNCPPDPLTCPPPTTSSQTKPVRTVSVPDNKTMLLQLGKIDLRLISPDQRQVLLHKNFRDISHCSTGQDNKDHFGFICRDVGGSSSNYGYLGYVFRCDSGDVVEDIMIGLRSAFLSANEKVERCDQCPMVWFNHLCNDMDGLAPTKAQSLLLRRIESLDQEERESLLAKMSGAETSDIAEQNQVLMMLLKVNLEVKQSDHLHVLTRENTDQSYNMTTDSVTQVALRAKKSLTDSLGGIIRRKMTDGSDVESQIPKPTPVKARPHPLSVTNTERRLAQEKSASPEKRVSPNKTMEPLTPEKQINFQSDVSSASPVPGGSRHRSRTVGAAGGETMKRELARRRLTRVREEKVNEEEASCNTKVEIFSKTGQGRSPSGKHTNTSHRQHIFQRVVTPVKSKLKEKPGHVKEARNYKKLWKNAIKQQILLNRMERENTRMLEHESHLAEKRLKLDYSDLTELGTEELAVWETILTAGTSWSDKHQLREAVAKGIPQSKRGDAWNLLMNLRVNHKKSDDDNRPPSADPKETKQLNTDLQYNQLKSRLTQHQHAILIDLGRTFPNHAYFSGALGPGQLGLFNLLKAYSIYDTEVGYCQGLPFSAGLLLMHQEEETAFTLLKHLLVTEGLRNQFNPDMSGLQLKMYQLTRLIAETHPALYKHLDCLQVDPSLYATPWFLTLFAASFPLGFVSRVYDLLFLEGDSSVIKVSLCLLVECEDEILASESLEDVMMVIKSSLPSLPPDKLEDVIRQSACLNIRRQLHTYQIEYQVLQEEQVCRGGDNRQEEVDGLSTTVSELRRQLAERDELVIRLTKQLEDKEKLIKELISHNQNQSSANNEENINPVDSTEII